MTRAVTIAELGDTNVFSVDGTNNRVGIGSTLPTTKLDVDGVIRTNNRLDLQRTSGPNYIDFYPGEIFHFSLLL